MPHDKVRVVFNQVGDIAELATDATDYNASIARESDSAKKSELASRLAAKRLAAGIAPELQTCFEALGLK